MEKKFSIVHDLLQDVIYNCLKFKQSYLILGVLLFTFYSCGKVINQRADLAFNREVSFVMMENQCANQISTDSDISKKIGELFSSQRALAPQKFFFINQRFYNSENPLIISTEKMETAYEQIKSNLNQSSEDLYYLYNGSRRYEDQKCAFNTLVEKKKYDIRPYLNIGGDCNKKYQSEKCNDSEYIGMTADKERWVRSNTIELCKSFSKDVNCQAEFNINQRKNSIGSMISRYYDRFQKERYSTLFKLRPTHLKYQCQSANDKTVMTIKILESSFDHDFLVELLKYTEETWSTKTFSLKLELVRGYSDDVVTILPTNKEISYVPDENNRLVYLSTSQDLLTTKRVFAHEFGHVLGFPDCYIEFFDDSKKELVYYEIAKSSNNIMCSLRSNVQVPDDYFIQLAENSCIFK